MDYPNLEINCYKIHYNFQLITSILRSKNISITPVTKVCSGDPVIANLLINAGAEMLADSRIQNLKKMNNFSHPIPKLLIRTPMLSEVESVIKYCEISLNSEIKIIKKLSYFAKKENIQHQIIVMVELGDRREGVMPSDLIDFIRNIISLPNIKIKGIGTNLACRYGVIPDDQKMNLLSELAHLVESTFNIKLDIISGGNSSSIDWLLKYKGETRINHLRIGEMIYFGCDTLQKKPINGLFTNAITLTAEIIESKTKPSLPWGNRGESSFGKQKEVQDKGEVSQAILALGRQDVHVPGLIPPEGIQIISATSDHLIIETSGDPFLVGQTITFELTYAAFLFSMSSDYIYKTFSKNKDLNHHDLKF